MIKQESFTDPERIYQVAKAKGMDYVTITDHNMIEGALELHDNHPEDTFVSTELTVNFPDVRKTPVHLLLYNIEPNQFDEVMYLRRNIFDVRNYIRETPNIVHSVAHPFKSVDKITRHFTHMVQRSDITNQLLVLFNNFEVRNERARHGRNDLVRSSILGLSPNTFYELANHYDIEPYAPLGWKKGVTGGTDDHCGCHIAETYTFSLFPQLDIAHFLDSIDTNNSDVSGNHGNLMINFDGYMKLVLDNLIKHKLN